MSVRQQAFVVVPLVILVLATAFGTLGYFSWKRPGNARPAGLAAAASGRRGCVLWLGLQLLGWLCKYRSPIEILRFHLRDDAKGRRTSGTARGVCPNGDARPPRAAAIRAASDVPGRRGAVPRLVAGVGLHVRALHGGLFFPVVNLVVIPFEEKECGALYPAEYAAYAHAVPRFFPAWEPRWP